MTAPATAAGIQDAARHLAEGRPADAVEMLDRIVRDFPTYVTAHVLLAKAREALGDEAEALAAWHAAYFLMPGSPLVVRERARLLRTDALPAFRTPEPEPPPEQEEPQQEEPQHKAQPEQEATATVGGEPSAWERDGQAGTATEPAASPASDAENASDWKIVEETASSRSASEEPIEPMVAPPVGHPHRSAQVPAHDGVPSDPLMDEEDKAEAFSDEPANDLASEDRTKNDGFVAEDGDGATAEVDDLDALIQQLENAPRIRPDLEFGDDVPEPEVAEGELVSETLARIYEAQGQYDEAARAYEQLASKHPGRATELLSKAAAMRQKAGGAEG